MLEALDSAHDTCPPEEGCIHADAFNENFKALHDQAVKAAIVGLEDSVDPIMAVLFAGIHIGYRLCQLVEAKTAKEKVN